MAGRGVCGGGFATCRVGRDSTPAAVGARPSPLARRLPRLLPASIARLAVIACGRTVLVVDPLHVAAACAVIGLAAVVTGCLLVSVALALVVGGATLITFGVLIDTPGRKQRGK